MACEGRSLLDMVGGIKGEIPDSDLSLSPTRSFKTSALRTSLTADVCRQRIE